MDQIDPVTLELHDALYRAGSELTLPYVEFGEGRDPTTTEAQQDLARAAGLFERVIEINPKNWNALWVLGMGRKAAGDLDGAYVAFKRAYAIEKVNPDVGREYSLVCVKLGKGPEAVRVAEEVHRLYPLDAGLLANYALTLLTNGDIDQASVAVRRALAMDPTDQITRNLATVVRKAQEVRS